MTVLIVDDSLMVRKKMKVMVEELGYRAIMATDGKEAIEIYNKEMPDIVTMDLCMPSMGGFDALKSIIAMDSYAKVIMSTANNSRDLVLASIKEGASGYIVKPIQIEILEDCINKAVHDIEIESKKRMEAEPLEMSNEPLWSNK